MPIDLKQLLGIMDIDSPNETISPGAHRDARNLVWRGPTGNMRAEVLQGTTEVTNPLLPDTGVNKNIGCDYDPINYQIITFNYNSLGDHGIYIYNTIPKTWQTLIQIGTGTDGDILGFTLDKMITSVAILYTEATDGNLLFFIDTIGRATCINIQQYSAVTPPYAVIKRSYIDLAKAPPFMPIQCCYENDYTTTVNNLRNSLFQFKYRHDYDNFQKSVTSTSSRVSLPNEPFDNVHDSDPTQNSRIALYVSTGDEDVRKIEILGRTFTDGGGQSDYFLIASLDKSELNIPDNDVYRFVFKNDGAYLPIDIEESNQLEDLVPIRGNALALLNGNVPVIGGILEGYDLIVPGLNITNISQVVAPSEISGFLYFGYDSQTNSGGPNTTLNLVVTGAGQNDSNGNPTFVPLFVGRLYITLTASDGTDLSFFVIVDGAHSEGNKVSNIMATIITAATGVGFTVVSQGPNTLTLSYPNGYFLGGTYFINELPYSGFEPVNEVCFAYPDQASEQFAISYFDDKGRTNGALIPINSTCKTLLDVTGGTINKISFSITSRPPLWAIGYDLLRLNRPTYEKRTFWVSNQTFVDVDLNTNVKYAYIGIANMVEYNQNIEAATPIVKYDFAPGDRIQLQVRYANDLTPSNMDNNLDYAIVSVADSPFFNGIQQPGRFIKIVYPSDDITPVFDFGGIDFQWYKIFLYSLKKQTQDTEEEVFYEFARRYGIGNSGTDTAFHIGEMQNQSSDLVTPAILSSSDGDYFYRFRNVPVGSIYDLTVGTVRYSDQYASMPIAVSGSPVTTPKYTIQSSSFTSTDDDNFDFADTTHFFFWNQSSSPITIRLQDEYELYCEQPLTHWMFVDLVNSTSARRVYLVQNFALSVTVGQGTSYTTKYDFYVSIPPNTKAFLISQGRSIDPAGTLVVQGSNLRLSIVSNISIPIIESSFSDNYNIDTNSNSRPQVYDENAKQVYYPSLIRWGLADQLNTSLNQTNRFYEQNFDEFDKSFGAIVRIKIRDREARWFQERRTGRSGIYSKFIQDNNGTNVLVTTDDIISKNNVEYYVGEFGIGNQDASLLSSGFDDYFVDPVKGFVLRVSPSGVDPISEQNRVQTWAGKNLPNYLSNYAYQFGGNARVIGCFWFCNDRPGEALFALQAGSYGANSIKGETFSFRELGNAWTSFYDISPDNLVCAENNLYGFYNGKLYLFNNTDTYANFFGIQFKPSITLIFNDKIAIKKTYMAIAYQSNNFWTSDNVGDVTTSQPNQQTGLPQISNLLSQDYEINEGLYYAAFMRDGNSMSNQQLAICEGDVLKGVWVSIKMSFNGSSFIYIFSPYISYIVSPRNL